MAVPVHDVLDGGAPQQDRRPSRALIAALTLAAVLAAALVALVEREPEQQAPAADVEVVGWMRFDDIDAQRVEEPSGDVEERNGTAVGVVRLEVGDRELRGGAHLAYDASIAGSGRPTYALHAWGDVSLRLDDTTCEGAFAWTNAEGPLEGGGALQVRCDDGATIAARLGPAPQPEWDLVIPLRDGWYRAGARAEQPRAHVHDVGAQVSPGNAEGLCDALLVSSPP